MGKIVTGLHDLLDTLPNSDFLCDWHKYESPTCSSIAPGILKRELQRLASSDRPGAPFQRSQCHEHDSTGQRHA